MKISLLTITSTLVFVAFLVYQYVVQEGLCVDSNQLWCGYYMGDVMRFGYFFLIFTAISLVVDNFFTKYRKNWLIFCSITVAFVFWGLVKINSDILHADLSNGSGFGWASILDDFIDKVAALGIYILFTAGSALIIFAAHKDEKSNAKIK